MYEQFSLLNLAFQKVLNSHHNLISFESVNDQNTRFIISSCAIISENCFLERLPVVVVFLKICIVLVYIAKTWVFSNRNFVKEAKLK